MKKKLLNYKKDQTQNKAKKATSPLVVSILLVVIVLFIISSIFIWFKFFSTESTETLENTDVVRPTKSNAEQFISSKSLVNGILKFKYSPTGNFEDLNIISYIIHSNKWRTHSKN